MHVVVFEGTYWKTFAPLALSRPVFQLFTGAGTLLQKQLQLLKPTRLSLWVRPALAEQCRQRIAPRLGVPTTVNQPLDDEPALLISGRTLLFGKFEYPPHESVALAEEDGQQVIRFAYVRRPGLSHEDALSRTPRWMELLDLPQLMPQGRLVQSLWDLVDWNEESIVQDWAHFRQGACAAPTGPYNAVHPEAICVGEGTCIEPGCFLDASRGPILLDANAHIGANSVLYGPCYVGPYSVIRPLSLIKHGVSLGPVCHVGGELAHSILLGYSNKSHDGYLGESYLGKWVNLGAGTCVSNLKNTYGQVTVKIGRREIPTGRRKVGAVIGDHSKTAILTRLMTGSYVGFCSQIACSNLPPRFVPSYTYLTDRGPEPYRMDKAIEVTKRVFARRDRGWTAVDEEIMRYAAQTAREVEA